MNVGEGEYMTMYACQIGLTDTARLASESTRLGPHRDKYTRYKNYIKMKELSFV